MPKLWQSVEHIGGTMQKWFVCPYCKKKLIKFNEDAKSKGIFLLCKKCGRIIEIKINNK